MKKIIDKSNLLNLNSRSEWRQWLTENYTRTDGIWIVNFKKHTGCRAITWSEAVEEALCFGWIDSTSRSLDEQRFMQFFTKRKPNSAWSRINKDKVKDLIRQGLMTRPGFDAVKLAKRNGSWTMLNTVEAVKLPVDLKSALNETPLALNYFKKLSRSNKKLLLQWLITAKTVKTREVRVKAIVAFGAIGQLPPAFRRPDLTAKAVEPPIQ